MTADSYQSTPESVDRALSSWRQGDCALGEHWFAHRLEKSLPITKAGKFAAEEDVDLAEEQVPGLVVVTQTCDVVRPCVERPYIEVCPLVEVDELRLNEIRKAKRPNYAFVPQLAERCLVASLDLVMTVEKPLVATWTRTPGWSSDEDARTFAHALGRKRTRFAFPDDFVVLAKKLQERLVEKHQKNSDEGRALRALREIRVLAAPSWEDDEIDITLYFIPNNEDNEFEGKEWSIFLQKWLALVPSAGRFKISGIVGSLNDLTAQDYVDSDPLDLDHLTLSGEPA